MIETDVAANGFEEIGLRVHDGLGLYGRHYPAPDSNRRPLLCLAGLTRNSRDFHDLAVKLSGRGEGARPVYTLDTRGRGQSDFAGDWRQYSVPVEMLDVQDFMAAQQLHGAAILGTSRGGLVAMVMAAAQPSLIGAVILNDIGPVIDLEGLLRISGFVGKSPLPPTWELAAKRLETSEKEFFPDIEESEWRVIAHQRFNEKGDKPAPAYDPEIARTFAALNDGPLPILWKQFLALRRAPCMVVRGELSDLLSENTATEMTQRHPDCILHTVPRQGHAPTLNDAPTQAAIRDFLIAKDPLV